MKEVDNSVVDLFHEELNKKQRKEERKIARIKAKEKKKQAKQQKLLEQVEDIEFAKKIEQKYSEDNQEKTITNELLEIKKEQTTRTKLNEKKTIKKHPILNFFLGLFLIILCITSIDFLIFSVLKEKNMELIMTGSLLCILSLFYILSIITKKESIKKFFQMIASLAITAYMCYQLFII